MANGNWSPAFNLRVSNLNDLRKNTDPLRFDAVLLHTVNVIGVMMEEDSNGYPPQPAPRNPRRKPYRRTGRAGSSMTSEGRKEGSAYVASVGSNLNYSPRIWALPDDEPIGQAWMHQGIWTPVATSVTKNTDRYIEWAEQNIYGAISG